MGVATTPEGAAAAVAACTAGVAIDRRIAAAVPAARVFMRETVLDAPPGSRRGFCSQMSENCCIADALRTVGIPAGGASLAYSTTITVGPFIAMTSMV